MTVSSSLLGSERADDCQFLEIDQSFCYIFFGVSHSATKIKIAMITCPLSTSRINSSRRTVGVSTRSRDRGGIPSPTQTHVGAPLHQTAFAIQVAVTRLGTLSDWLGQGEGSSRNQAFRLPPNHSTCPPGLDRFVTSEFVIQSSNPESSRDLKRSITIRLDGFWWHMPQSLAKTPPRHPGRRGSTKHPSSGP